MEEQTVPGDSEQGEKDRGGCQQHQVAEKDGCAVKCEGQAVDTERRRRHRRAGATGGRSIGRDEVGMWVRRYVV